MHLTPVFLVFLLTLVGSASATWKGQVVNKCSFPIWAKTTKQFDNNHDGKLDSPMVKVNANGGTYNAAYDPIYGDSEAGEAHGITVKLEKEADATFTTGHVYQIEWTPYWYQDPNQPVVSGDISIVDGNPFTSSPRKLEVLGTDGKLVNIKKCGPRTQDEPRANSVFCAANNKSCLYEWQKNHALQAYLDGIKSHECPPMNSDPKCSHPIECNVTMSGTVRFTLCA